LLTVEKILDKDGMWQSSSLGDLVEQKAQNMLHQPETNVIVTDLSL
jgi:hypothetical protein